MRCIVLVGGSRLLRGGLKRVLEETGAKIAGEHASAEEVTPPAAGAVPVIYLLMQTSGSHGIRREIDHLRQLDPESRIAVMRANLATHDLVETFTAGADGFILEEISAEALRDSLGLVALGEKVFPSQLATLISGDKRTSEAMFHDSPLTGREREIVQFLTQGKSNKEIANDLNLALATVKVHVKSLLRKLGLHNRTQAAIWALDAGLVEPPEVTVEVTGRLTKRRTPAEAAFAEAAEKREYLRRNAALAKSLMSSSVVGRSPTSGSRSAELENFLGARLGSAPPKLPTAHPDEKD